ncbi:MAG: site-specific integrase [Planctomycetota bacterium]|nr:MAG: site-specific integrase [Planctomycetota bacterium]
MRVSAWLRTCAAKRSCSAITRTTFRTRSGSCSRTRSTSIATARYWSSRGCISRCCAAWPRVSGDGHAIRPRRRGGSAYAPRADPAAAGARAVATASGGNGRGPGRRVPRGRHAPRQPRSAAARSRGVGAARVRERRRRRVRAAAACDRGARLMRGRALGPGRLYRRGDQWALDWRDATGRRQHRSLSHDRRTAERIRSELIHKRDLERAGLGIEAGQETPLAELVASYIEDLRPRVCPRHHELVEARLTRLLAKLGPVRVQDLKPMLVTRARNEFAAAGAAPRTANLMIDSLGACLRWAARNELIAKNPIANVERLPDGPAHATRRRRPLTDDESARLLAAIDADDHRLAMAAEVDGRVRVPQAPFLRFLVTLGTRYGETRLIAWSAVDFERRTIVLRAETTKSRKQRVIPLNDELIAMLRALQALQARALGRVPRAEDLVFLTAHARPWCEPSNNIRRIFDRVLRRAGIRRVDPDGTSVDLHALRGTAATRWARRGVPISIAQRMLGHSDVRTTAAHYIRVEVEDLRVALEGAPAAARRSESA